MNESIYWYNDFSENCDEGKVTVDEIFSYRRCVAGKMIIIIEHLLRRISLTVHQSLCRFALKWY